MAYDLLIKNGTVIDTAATAASGRCSGHGRQNAEIAKSGKCKQGYRRRRAASWRRALSTRTLITTRRSAGPGDLALLVGMACHLGRDGQLRRRIARAGPRRARSRPATSVNVEGIPFEVLERASAGIGRPSRNSSMRRIGGARRSIRLQSRR